MQNVATIGPRDNITCRDRLSQLRAAVGLRGFVDGECVRVLKNLNTGRDKKPRFVGELGDLSHAKVRSSEFRYSKKTEIFGQGEPADYIYQVIEGSVRTHKLLPDGRRQIGAFHLPGDIFGLENESVHRFTAEAIVATTVRVLKRESIEREATTDVAIVRSLLKMTTESPACREPSPPFGPPKCNREGGSISA